MSQTLEIQRPQRRTVYLHFRLSEDEVAPIDVLCDQTKLGRSEVCRQLMQHAVRTLLAGPEATA